jgi:hypothetical protein
MCASAAAKVIQDLIDQRMHGTGSRAKDTDEKIQAMLHSKGDCHLQRRERFGIIHFPRVAG